MSSAWGNGPNFLGGGALHCCSVAPASLRVVKWLSDSCLQVIVAVDIDDADGVDR